MENKFKIGTAVLLAAFAMQSCTGGRQAQFDDEELAAMVVEIAQVNGATATVSVSDDEAQTALRNVNASSLRVEGQVKTLLTDVTSFKGPDRLRLMLRDLPVRLGAKESRDLTLKFSVDAGAIYASRLANVADVESELDLAIAQKDVANAAQVWIPVLQVKVDAHGVVKKAKNPLGEETRSLKLVPRDFAESTHVQVDLLSRKSRQDLVTDTKDTEQRFRKNALIGKLFSKKDLLEQLTVNVADESVLDATLFQVRMGRTNGTLDLFRVKDKKDLTQAEKEALASGQSVSLACDQAVKDDAALKGLTLPTECVLVSEFALEVSFELAKREVVTGEGGDATIAPGVKYEQTLKPSEAIAVTIAKFQEVKSDSGRGLMGTRAMTVAALKGKEFLMRRTLQDSPNGFDFAFAGLSGSLEIVKLKFEQDKVAVVRSRPLIPNAGGSHVDAERLMVLPAQYKKLVKSSDGSIKVVAAQFDEVDAIAEVGLEDDQLVKNDTSPMSFYDFSVCFNESGDKVLADVDNRLGADGSLNFTLSSTYVTSPNPDCRFVYQQTDFMSANQTAFRFDERVSFKLYTDTDETPLRSIPYSAQKRLGFGLFTREKTVPNTAGNTGTEKTQIPMAAVFDIRTGQKITYVLGGLPETGEVRERIIEATRDVVKDLNVGMRRALEGTPMARTDDVVELKVEGLDVIPERKMGDLDRNYIYYIQKPTESGVIGLGGAHANPRTGRVEAASVFMYGGNMIAMVESLKKRERAQNDYDALLAALSVTDLETLVSNAGAPGGAAGHGAMAAKTAMKPNFGSQASVHSLGEKLDSKGKVSAADLKKAKAYQALLKALKSSSPVLSDSDAGALAKNKAEFTMYRAFRKVIEEKASHNTHKASAIFGKAILEAYRSKMSSDEAERLSARVNAHEGTADLLARIQGAGTCVYDVSHAAESVAANLGNKSLLNMSDIDALVAVWKPTLAHEIGHNLGLRHNFIATADKAHHVFEAGEVSTRDYSSVMDYNPNDHFTYDGLGPYDVAALRAGYTGLVELSADTVKKHVVDVNGQKVLKGAADVPVVADKLVALEDYRSALGVASWLNFSTGDVAQLPLEPYQYCDDYDAGEQPLCNRFDSGTTPEEMVAASIRTYDSLYQLRNMAGDQVRFGYDTLPSYLGRVVGLMLPVRQFLEEAILKLIDGAPMPEVMTYVNASVDGFQFFHSIVRTPDADASAGFLDSFVPLKVTQAGVQKTVVVQQKWLQDIAFDDTSDRLLIRGVELDKVFAMLMLTERNMGWERYERRSLRFSYPEFEKLLIQGNAIDMPTNGLLMEVLGNNLEPMTRIPGGGMVRLPMTFESDVTETMRIYALIGLLVNQDVSGLEAKDNNAALFRVLSGFTAPAGVAAVVQPGANLASPASLKYWAMDQAEGSTLIVDLLDAAADLESKRTDLEGLVKDLVILRNGPQPDATDAAAVAAHKAKVVAAEAALEAKIATLKTPVAKPAVADIEATLDGVVDLAKALAIDPAAADLNLVNRQLMRIARSELVYSVLLSGLVQAGEDIQVEGLEDVIGRSALSAVSVQRGVLSGNLDTMNSILLSMHPELK